MDVSQIADRIAAGDRRALARAITLVESSRPDHRGQAGGQVKVRGAVFGAESEQLGNIHDLYLLLWLGKSPRGRPFVIMLGAVQRAPQKFVACLK